MIYARLSHIGCFAGILSICLVFSAAAAGMVGGTSPGAVNPPANSSQETGSFQEKGQRAQSLAPMEESGWDIAAARHLLLRAGFGGTPAEIERLHAMGLHAAVDHLVDFESEDGWELPLEISALAVERPEIDRRQLAELSPDEREQKIRQMRQQIRRERTRKDRQQLQQLRQWWMQRMLQSPCPLEEKLVLFWHGHFATEHQTVKSAYAMYLQNELFRQQAAGNFGELLRGIVHDPAMLRYLDNDRNVKTKPNENLAREILELFSMGEGNYTEQDIREAARALTGYGINRQTLQADFRRRAHDPGKKTIFGQTGNWDGDDLVDLILQQPATARFIARKLFLYFVHREPSEALVEQLADVLRNNDYELRPVLKTLFVSREFYSSRAMGTQIKSPVQLVVGFYKSLGVSSGPYLEMAAACRTMGQQLFDPPNVKGWDGGTAWINTNSIFDRSAALAGLINGVGSGDARRGGSRRMRNSRERNRNSRALDIIAILKPLGLQSNEDVVAYLANACLAVPLTESSQQQLIQIMNAGSPLADPADWQSRREQVNKKLVALLVLITSLPEFQIA